MKKELEDRLKKEFSFMRGGEENHSYQRWGCQCSDGWYDLIFNLCKEIDDRYKKDNREVDLTVVQVKEKFATLRFYYIYEDTPLQIYAIDSLNGTGIRFTPENKDLDEDTYLLRKDIAEIVRVYEKKSGEICEVCGLTGTIRKDLLWVRTLCDGHYQENIRVLEEKNKKRKRDINEYLE